MALLEYVGRLIFLSLSHSCSRSLLENLFLSLESPSSVSLSRVGPGLAPPTPSTPVPL